MFFLILDILGVTQLNSNINVTDSNRLVQFTITKNREKVWPIGTVHYIIDSSLSKLDTF